MSMNADATPFIPGKNANAAPFIPGGGGASSSSTVANPNLSASASPFIPGGASSSNQHQQPRNNNNHATTGGIGFGQQQRGPTGSGMPQHPFARGNNNNNQQQNQNQQQPYFNNNSNQQQGNMNYNNNNNNNGRRFNNNNNNNGGYNNNNNSINHHQNYQQQQQQPRYNNQNNNNQHHLQHNNNGYNNNNKNNFQQQQQAPPPVRQHPNHSFKQNQQQQQPVTYQYPLPEGQVRTLLPVNHRPLVFLFLGPRGSGKSTQAQLLAKRLGLAYFSSGAAVTEEKREPFLALVEAIDNALSKPTDASGNSTLRGIVLDRVIANGTIDCLFLLHLLHKNSKFNLQLDMAIVLNGDYLTAQERAESRDKDNEKKKEVAFSKRMQEHSAVFDATENILQSYGGLFNVQVNAGDSIEIVHKTVCEHVDKYIVELKGSSLGSLRTRVFPRLKLMKLGAGVSMDADVQLWLGMRDKMHQLVGTPAHKFTQFPGSNVGNVLTQFTLQDMVLPYKNKYNVTYKADGIRVMIVRTHSHGTFLVTAKFMCRFIFEEVEKFVQQQQGNGNKVSTDKDAVVLPKWFPKAFLPTALAEKSTIKLPTSDKEIDLENPFKDFTTSDVTHMIDAELVVFEGNPELTKEQQAKLPPWRIYAFDCLVHNGQKQHHSSFNLRYQALVDFFRTVYEFDGNQLLDEEKRFVLKPFVSATQVTQLLSTTPEFPIDGLLFQQPGQYMVPRDTRSLKWKIPSQCTIDFRLSNGYFDESRKMWMFIPCVIGFREEAAAGAGAADKQAKRDEIPFEKAIVEIPDDKIANFCDGSIAECVQVREPARFQASGNNNNNKNNKKAVHPIMQMIANHPLSQAVTPLSPPVKRRVPGFFIEFWKTRGGSLHESDQEFATQDGVTLWEVVRDRTADKPSPNLEEVATATAHMKHVTLEDLVNSVCRR